METDASPTIRAVLAATLEAQAKDWGRNQVGGAASFKYLGDQHIKVAPSRLTQLTDPEFEIEIKKANLASQAKAITGFASSVYKVLAFLTDKGIGDARLRVTGEARDHLVCNLVESYWPKSPVAGIVEFGSKAAQDWIKQSIISAATRTRTDRELNIQVNIVKWGPFSHRPFAQNESEQDAHFLLEYGRGLLATVDPVSFDASAKPLALIPTSGTTSQVSSVFIEKDFEDAIADVPQSKPGEWRVTLGIYDSLIRQYRGYTFVTYPIRVPIVGLVLSASTTPEIKDQNLLTFLEARHRNSTAEDSAWAFAVPEESGHLFLGRILPSAKIALLDEKRTGTVSLTAEQIAERLVFEFSEAGKAIVFASDTILCAQTHRELARLAKSGKFSVFPVSQAKGSQNEFSFRTGFMLRDEDQKLANLLSSAQSEMFRSAWQSEKLLRHLLRMSAAWVATENPDWPFPLFSIDNECLSELASTPSCRSKILKIIDEHSNLIDLGEIT
jgi:hypothetical protein